MRARSVCLLGLLILMIAIADAAAQTRRDVELAPGLLIDQRRGLVIVMNADGGIDALSLSDGAAQWRSEAAAMPLAVADGRLIAMGDQQGADNSLEIVALDVERGTVLARDTIALPENVNASVEDTLSGRFDIDALIRRGDAVLRWRFDREEISGAFQDNGETGIVEGETEEGMRGVVAFRLSSGELREAPILAPALDLNEALPPQLSVRTRADGRPGVEGAPAADRRHVMTSEMIAETGPERFLWTISEASSGARVGAVRVDVSYAPFLIERGLLILQGRPSARMEANALVELPVRVRALSLATNEQVWTHEMRDIELRILPP